MTRSKTLLLTRTTIHRPDQIRDQRSASNGNVAPASGKTATAALFPNRVRPALITFCGMA